MSLPIDPLRPQIEAACNAFEKEAIPFLTQDSSKRPLVSTLADPQKYRWICRNIVAQTAKGQLDKGVPVASVKIWTPEQVAVIGEFKKKYSLDPVVQTTSTSGIFTDGIKRVWINIGLGKISAEELKEFLGHEVGHIEDNRKLTAKDPRVKNILEGQQTDDNLKVFISVYLEQFRKAVPTKDRKTFDQLSETIIGNFSLMGKADLISTILLLGELYRFGQESKDKQKEGQKSYRPLLNEGQASSEQKSHLEQLRPLQGVEVSRLLLVAKLQAIGIWPTFKTKPNLRPDLLKDVQEHPQHLKFFGMCIQAAAKN